MVSKSSLKVKHISSHNKFQEGSVLYISLVILIALGFLFNSFHQSQIQFSKFHSQVKFESQKESILNSTKRLIQQKIQLNPSWVTNSYIHYFNDHLGVEFNVSPWGLAKRIAIQKIHVRAQVDSTNLPTWIYFNQIPSDEVITLTLLDSSSSLTLGGRAFISGSLSSNKAKIDYASRYQIRYTNKTKSNPRATHWKLLHPSEYSKSTLRLLRSPPLPSYSLLLDSNSRYRDTLLTARSIRVNTLARFKNSLLIADTIILNGQFDYLNAQFIARKKLTINARVVDSLESIEGYPIFVSLGLDSTADTTHVQNLNGLANIYQFSKQGLESQSILKIDSKVNGIGVIQSDIPIQHMGQWSGAVTAPSLTYKSKETLWKNLLYQGHIREISDYSEVDSLIYPGDFYE